MGTRSDLPTGTVTFVFTDVEGSTKLLHALGADAYAAALATHRHQLRAAFAQHGGVEVDTQGDAFFVAFPTAPGALAAARAATEQLAAGPIRVRIGLHTGTPLLTDEGYIGADVHKGARIAAAGHGGQVLVSAATAALLEDALIDLGLHRLKDLTAPERIFQADAGEHPPLKTLHQTNLPIPATPFLGRDDELIDLATLLARDDVRLLTLTGPGGIGKTRLALQVAAAAADAHPDGVWWVPLAALRDPRLVLETAAKALGASGDLAAHIGDKRLLLLLDNFEHLVEAADDLAPTLAACPNLTLLVTSRQPLHLAGEHEYAVEPLQADDAVELFLTRAIAARRDVAANGEVALICERLDRLPLAIELAAARVKVLSPAVLLERLEQRLPLLAGGARDAPERQRTLRATIEWSHELLTPDEQALFARLAIFRGGWTLEAAEAVADADLDTLQSLVDKSLVRVRPESGRFWMLETIREFAVERLIAAGEGDELRRRLGDAFLKLAEVSEPAVMRDDVETLDRLALDHDNLRAVLDLLLEIGDRESFVRLTGSLWRFWYLRSHLLEGRRHLEAALAMDGRPSARMAKVRRGLAVMTLNLGDIDAARDHATVLLELDRQLGDQWGVAYATMMLAHCLAEARDNRRDLAAARDRNLEAAALFERLGDRQFALLARHNATWIHGELGDREAERRGHQQNLVEARAIGNESIEADALAQLGMSARDDGRLDDAAALLRDALRVERHLGMPLTMANQLGRLASVIARQGDLEKAARLVGAARAAEQQLGSEEPWWATERRQETMEQVTVGLGPARTGELVASGARLTLEEAIDLALEA